MRNVYRARHAAGHASGSIEPASYGNQNSGRLRGFCPLLRGRRNAGSDHLAGFVRMARAIVRPNCLYRGLDRDAERSAGAAGGEYASGGWASSERLIRLLLRRELAGPLPLGNPAEVVL